MNFVTTLEGEALETYQSTGQIDNPLEMWGDCLSLDLVIEEILEDEDDSWKPAVQGFQNTGQKGREFSKEITEGRGEAEAWQCLNCGAVIKNEVSQMACPICELGKPWQKTLQQNMLKSKFSKSSQS